MTRDEQQSFLEALKAEHETLVGRLREIEHDRDVIAAWLEGYAARDEEAQRADRWPSTRSTASN